MIANIFCLRKALEALGVPYRVRDRYGNFVTFGPEDSVFFVGSMTPLNSETVSFVARDKEFTHVLLKDHVRMAETLSFLDPHVEEPFTSYERCASREEIAEKISGSFAFPCVVKRNRGSKGTNVFLCRTKEDLLPALDQIFDKGTKEYDYVALAQERVAIRKEYRVIVLDGRIELAYEKDISRATFSGNMSPLHWENARAVPVEDPALLESLSRFIQPMFSRLPLRWGGLDVALDEDGSFWLIEVNTKPGFSLFIKDNGPERIIGLYKKVVGNVLGDLV